MICVGCPSPQPSLCHVARLANLHVQCSLSSCRHSIVICVGPPSIYPATSMCLPIFPTSMCHSLYPMRSYSVMQHHCSCVSRLSHCTCTPSARFVCASLASSGSGSARIAGTLTQLAWGVRAKAFVSASLGLALSSCVCELGARTQLCICELCNAETR